MWNYEASDIQTQRASTGRAGAGSCRQEYVQISLGIRINAKDY